MKKNLLALAAAGLAAALLWPIVPDRTESYIIQGEDVAAVADQVRASGGTVTHELGIIDAVAAELTAGQAADLADRPQLRLYGDRAVETAGKPDKGGGDKDPGPTENFLDTDYPTLIGADRLHAEAIRGAGVTVAVVDTGYWTLGDLEKDSQGNNRILDVYDARKKAKGAWSFEDKSGHSSHVASVMASSGVNDVGESNGVAPDVQLLMVKAFDEDGKGTYADVIAALDWVVLKKDYYNVRVLNLSFSAEPQSHYWDDPLNQAVMKAWQAGIVVVASAGNLGPDPMTIGVPGNVPYVITVGAMTDNYTPADGSDDLLASFSSTGPTVEGFVKPEIVAPGGHMLGLMNESWAKIAQEHPEFQTDWRGFRMSGTSQATAVVSGVVAMMLEREPFLTPDDVKCKLMSSARPALDDNGNLAYSIFQQGAGVVNAYDAVYVTDLSCANNGLDIAKDLDGTAHYGGLANQNPDGSYYIMGLDGYLWRDGYMWSDGYIWSDGYLWRDAFLWSDAFMWSDGYMWRDAFMWSDAFLWSDNLTEPASINVWVPQE